MTSSAGCASESLLEFGKKKMMPLSANLFLAPVSCCVSKLVEENCHSVQSFHMDVLQFTC